MLRFILIVLLAALTSFMPSSEKKGYQDIERRYDYIKRFDMVTGKEGDWQKSYNEFTFKAQNIIHRGGTAFNTTVYKILDYKHGTNPYGQKHTQFTAIYGNEKYSIVFWHNSNMGIWIRLEESSNTIEFNNPR